jgi:prepilin-type N-terminal cleavage/methylation domain-containing protein
MQRNTMSVTGLKKLRKLRIMRDERGFTLVEVLTSIALLGLVGAALYAGLGTTSKVLLHNDTWQTAKNLAETQAEYVKEQRYQGGSGNTIYIKADIPVELQGSYDASIDVIDGWTLVPLRDGYLQKIIVTITGPTGITYTLESYKVR